MSAIFDAAKNTVVGIRHPDHVAPLYPQKLALTSPTNGGRSISLVRSRTQATELISFSLWKQLRVLRLISLQHLNTVALKKLYGIKL
jgi:hypothetical protein